MNKFEKLKIISEKLKNCRDLYSYKYLYFEPDFNGFSGKRGIFYGQCWRFCPIMISGLMLQTTREGEYFPDPGIAIYDGKTNKLIDTIYWYENPEKIFDYFPLTRL